MSTLAQRLLESGSETKIVTDKLQLREAGNLGLVGPRDATGMTWDVVVIESGLSANDRLYRPEMLAKNLGVFDRAPIRIYGFDGRRNKEGREHNDHIPTEIYPMGSGVITRNTVGFIESPRMEKVDSLRRPGRKVEAMCATLHLDDEILARKLLNSWNSGGIKPGLRSTYELSIDAEGPHQAAFFEGKRVIDVLGISHVKEVSIVSDGAAGGRFQRMVASATFEEAKLAHETKLSQDPEYSRMWEAQLLEFFTANTSANSERGSIRVEEISSVAIAESEIELAESKYRKALVKTLKDLGHKDSLEDHTTGKLAKLVSDKAGKVSDAKEHLQGLADEETVDAEATANALADDTDADEPELSDPIAAEGAENEPDEGTPEDQVEDATEEEVLQKNLLMIAQLARSGDLSAILQLVGKMLVGEAEEGPTKALDDAEGDGGRTEKENASRKGAGTGQKAMISESSKAILAEAVQEAVATIMASRKDEAIAPEPEAIEEPLELQGADQREDTQKLVESNPKQEKEPKTMAIGATAGVNGGSDFTQPPQITQAHFEEFADRMAQDNLEVRRQLRESLEISARQQQIIEERDEKLRLQESRNNLISMMQASKLPPAVAAILQKRFEGRVFESEELEEAIQEQKQICSLFVESNPNSDGGHMEPFGAVTAGRNRLDWFGSEMDILCGYKPSQDGNLTESEKDNYKGIKEQQCKPRRLFEAYYGNPECNMTDLAQVGRHAILREASTTSLPELLSAAQNKALVQYFRSVKTTYQMICDIISAASIKKLQRRIHLGGFGRIPVVAESDVAATYLTGGGPADEESTYNLEKRGLLATISWEAVLDDDLNAFRLWPQLLGRSCADTLEDYVWQLVLGMAGQGATPGVINTAQSWDDKIIYSDSHNNFTDEEMSVDEVLNACNRMDDQYDFGNVGSLLSDVDDNGGASTADTISINAELNAALKAGIDHIKVDAEYMKFVSAASATVANVVRGAFGSTPVAHESDNSRVEQVSSPIQVPEKWLVHSIQQRGPVYRILGSDKDPETPNNAVNPLFADFKEGRLTPLMLNKCYLGHVISRWLVLAKKVIELAFLNGKQDPEFWMAADPINSQGLWTGDRFEHKCRHVYGGYALDHRLMQAGFPA